MLNAFIIWGIIGLPLYFAVTCKRAGRSINELRRIRDAGEWTSNMEKQAREQSIESLVLALVCGPLAWVLLGVAMLLANRK